MKSFAVLALAATAAMAQSPPSGCKSSSSGSFNIQTVNVTTSGKRDLSRRQLSGALTISLNDGVLKDQAGRQGYIASNYQFQFDAGLQAGARESTGFSLCSNNTLALSANGRSAPAVFYQCLSGDFYNLYSQSTGAQCIPIYITAVMTSGGGASQISDGQPQVTMPPVVSQISDGQPQASTPGAVVSQISDGQPQAGTPAPSVVSQISDGQPQAGTPAPKPTGPVVSQISDGQPQAGTPKPSLPIVSQISDGQPQAPTPVGPVVSQISDGQPQAGKPGNATMTAAPSQFTGGASTKSVAAGGFVAGLFGLLAML